MAVYDHLLPVKVLFIYHPNAEPEVTLYFNRIELFNRSIIQPKRSDKVFQYFKGHAFQRAPIKNIS